MEKTEDLTLKWTDLVVLKEAIEVAAERGAFKASEMQAIGAVYDKLNVFIMQIRTPANTVPAQTSNQGE